MGGRGASSANGNARENFVKSFLGQFITDGDIEAAVMAYAMRNKLTPRQENELIEEIQNRNAVEMEKIEKLAKEKGISMDNLIRETEVTGKSPMEILKRIKGSNTVSLNNQSNITAALKKYVNVDIGKAVDNDRFSTKSRKYFDIDRRKLNQNEFNAVVKYLKQDKGLRIEANGANHYSIYFKK